MSYVDPDYTSKKAFKEAIGNGRKHETYNPSGLYGDPVRQNGTDTVEGPHGYHRWYAAAHGYHRWYAAVLVADGLVVACEGIKLGQHLVCSVCKAPIDRTQSGLSRARAPRAKPACKDCVTAELTARRELANG